MPAVNLVLCGLAANAGLSSELVDRLIAVADADLAGHLAVRTDLSHAQAVALLSRVEDSGVHLAYEGLLTAADIDPATQPHTALALLDEGSGSPERARLFAADPVSEHREKLASCPGLPAEVVETLAADSDLGVVAELALWTTPEAAARLAEHPHAEVHGRQSLARDERGQYVRGRRLVARHRAARRCLVCDREATPFVHGPQCPRHDCDLLPGASCDGSHESAVHEIWQAALRNPATPTEVVVSSRGWRPTRTRVRPCWST
jgi:hypothetical protein